MPLPLGFALNSTTGVITGNPTVGGTFTYIAQVTDANGQTATCQCTITIPAIAQGQGARKPVPLPVNGFDFCLHREYRLYCSINVALLTCGSIPACFSVDERDWGVDA